MNDWYSVVFKGFMFASVSAFMISFFSSGLTAYGAEIAGYSTIILAIIMILLILFQKSSMFSSSCFILLFSVIAFILYLTTTNKTHIVKGRVAPYFKTFSTISIILVMIQTYIMYSSMYSDRFEKTNTIPAINTYILYFLGIVTFVCSIIMHIILKYYRTDG